MSQTITPLLCGIDEASMMLSIPKKTIRNKLSNKTCPIPKVEFGGRTMFRISDIYQFVATGKPVLSAPAARDPHTDDLVSGLTDAEIKPRRGRRRLILKAT